MLVRIVRSTLRLGVAPSLEIAGAAELAAPWRPSATP